MRRNPADPTSLGFLTTSSPETDRELTTFATQYRTFRAGSQSQTICEDNLARSYPRVHAVLKRELVSNLSLLYAWTGSDPLLDPMGCWPTGTRSPSSRAPRLPGSTRPFRVRLPTATCWGAVHPRQSSNRCNAVELPWKPADSASTDAQQRPSGAVGFGKNPLGCRLERVHSTTSQSQCRQIECTCRAFGFCLYRRSRIAGAVRLESESNDPSHSPLFTSRSPIDDSRKRR